MIDTTMNPRPQAEPSELEPSHTASAFKRRLLAACLCVGAPVFAPSSAFAQDEDIKVDGRLEGYQGSMSVENQSTALIWLLFVFLGVVALAPLFKDAKRTHLD